MSFGKEVFIKCAPSNLLLEEGWSARLFPLGTYLFNSGSAVGRARRADRRRTG